MCVCVCVFISLCMVCLLCVCVCSPVVHSSCPSAFLLSRAEVTARTSHIVCVYVCVCAGPLLSRMKDGRREVKERWEGDREEVSPRSNTNASSSRLLLLSPLLLWLFLLSSSPSLHSLLVSLSLFLLSFWVFILPPNTHKHTNTMCGLWAIFSWGKNKRDGETYLLEWI